MKKLFLSMASLPLIIGGLSVSVSADEGINILDNVKVNGEIRPRYESADVKDNGIDGSSAFTARTHLAVTGGLLGVENLNATVGVQSVNNFGYTQYAPASTGYDVIADPQQAMLSEASIDYALGKTAVHAGRSHVNLDNQRFIGTVGWRQSERSYDTVYVADNNIENLNVLAAYVYGFAGVGSVTTTDTKSYLLHANYKVMDELSVTAYDYMLADIHDTMGVALTGSVNAGAKIDYRLEYAIQKDASQSYASSTTTKADANYMNVDIGANISGILLGVNYEVLSGTTGSDGKTAFSTPLATAHAFNGWADKFLATPSGGLIDANVRLGYTAKGFGKLLGVYHTFASVEKMATATTTDTDLGTEMDAVYTNAIPGVNGLSGLVKYAAYSKGAVTGYTTDVAKIWLMLDYKFTSK